MDSSKSANMQPSTQELEQADRAKKVAVYVPDFRHLMIDLETYAGRIAARAFAYALMGTNPDQKETADAILYVVGREG